MKKTVLSIDFDYFVRENPMWDFGHNEDQSVFRHTAWIARYMSTNLYEECDPAKYADMMPKSMPSELEHAGFLMKNARMFVADSHKDAYKAIKKVGECEIYHFDAHSDMYPGMVDMNCGNWLLKLYESGKCKVNWIYPKWMDEFGGPDNKFNYNIDVKKFSELNAVRNVDLVFICRSSAWVPPHLDPQFVEMVYTFGQKIEKVKVIDKCEVRPAPDKKQATEMYNDYLSMVDSLRRKHDCCQRT